MAQSVLILELMGRSQAVLGRGTKSLAGMGKVADHQGSALADREVVHWLGCISEDISGSVEEGIEEGFHHMDLEMKEFWN